VGPPGRLIRRGYSLPPRIKPPPIPRPARTGFLRGEHFDAHGTRLWSAATDAGGYVGKDLLGMSIGADPDAEQAQAFSDTAGGFITVYAPGPNRGPFSLRAQAVGSS
jgi:hypothetical protein